ncbi:GIN domain-containing protein [Fibrella aestuarina]|nr:DUF2807 domain-containing protein [Fibrella aestuarina]
MSRICRAFLSNQRYGLITLTTLLLASCSATDETLTPVKDFSQFNTFTNVQIGSGFRTTIRQGTARQVLISVPSVDERTLSVTQSSNTLVVEIRNKASKSAIGTVDITMPTLTGADFSGGVAATIAGFTTGTLPISQSGGSSVTLSSTVQKLLLTLTGGSRFEGYSTPVTDATVALSGGSEARVAASGTLTITASGGSRLYYKGTPQLNQNLSGGSTVTSE